jgi:alpha-N-acetylglucosamine transferase
VWELTQYDKVVFMDADILVRQNVDELFAQPELSAVEDCCDYFNSGMMVLVPSAARFKDMIDKLPTIRSHDGADQGFLNVYFSKWNHLPFFYNALQTTYLNYNFHKAWKQQADKIKCIHFIEFKPWKKADAREDLKELHDEWHAMKAKADALTDKN